MMKVLGNTPYKAHLRARGLRPATVAAYTGWVQRLTTWLGHDPATATTEDLEAWIAAHDWAPNSHQKAVQAIQYFYRWLTVTGRIDADPAATLTPARKPRPVSRPCPEDVYATALDNAHGQSWWRLRLAGETGLRRGELAAVHSRDAQLLAGGWALHVVGKGGVQRRVPLPDDLAAWLGVQHGWVFPNRTGGHLCAGSVGRWYARHLGRNVHSLRHRYASMCYRQGHDIESVSALLGHASVATTQHYLTVAEDDLRAAASGAWTDAA